MLLGLLALLLSTASVAGAAPFAYVSYSSTAGGRVAVIDASPTAACSNPVETGPCVAKTLVVGASPVGVAVNPAGTFAYVANAGDNSVSVIRTSSNPADIAVLTAIPNVGFGPWGVAVSPDNAKVYVGLSDGSVAVIDANNLSAAPTRITNVGGFLNGIVAVGSLVFVSDSTNRQVVVIDGLTQRVIKGVTVGSATNSNTSPTPMGLVANPSGTRVYVADLKFDDNLLIDVFEVSGIDVALLEVVETFVVDPFPLTSMADNTLAAPGGIAISPDGKKLYVANDGLEVFDPATRTIRNDVTIITLANGSRAHVNVGTTPVGVATDPSGLAYVANQDSGTVSVIDPSTNTLVKTVGPLGGAPSVFGAFATGGPPQFALTLLTVGGGSITPNPSSANGSYDAGRGVLLTASPDANSQFTGWSGDCSGTSTTCTVTMDAPKSVTATFTPLYALWVTTIGSGTVAAQPASATGKYLAGTDVTLTATPAADYVFTSWTGACSGSNTTCTVTMDAAKSVTATFTAQYALVLTALGNGSIGAVPAPGPLAGKYPAGTEVTLTATPGLNSVFTSWAGACAGSATSCKVTMDAAKSVTATFTLKQYQLTLTTAGSGTGTVAATPSSATGMYNAGTVVTLTAAPSANSQFTSWTGCSGSGASCTVTMNGAATVTATFTLKQYALTLTTVGSGTISATPSSATGMYNAGAVVSLTATPAAGYQFSSWTGCTGTSASCSVTMDTAKSVTATFTATAPAQFTLTLDTVGSGSIAADPPVTGGASALSLSRALQPAAITGKYNSGTVVALTPTAAPGFKFTGWTGACSGTGPCSVRMDSDKTVTATFTVASQPPATCDEKIKDWQKKVADHKHPWWQNHQLTSTLKMRAEAQEELGKAKAKVGERDKRYIHAKKEFDSGKSALCHGHYWRADHEFWETLVISKEILRSRR